MIYRILLFPLEIAKGAYKCIKAQIRHTRGKSQDRTIEDIHRDVQKQANRLKTCSACVFEQQNICIVCTCILEEKTKMPEESCPEGFWENGLPDKFRK
jgi:hypothetical protein